MPFSMRRIAAALASACALAAPGPTWAWNAGTHLHVAQQLLGRAAEPRLLMEAGYGANALDLFNNDFTSPAWDLGQWLHDPSRDLYMNVWRAEATSAASHRAFAFGVVSHNEAWGADATAHHSGLTSGKGVGWVIEKAGQLAPVLDAMARPYLAPLGISLTQAQLLDIGHNFVEQAVDLLMLEDDPALGWKLMAAAAGRDPSDPAMLEVAWSHHFAPLLGGNAAAVQTIRGYEAAGLREFLVAYGWAMSQPDPIAFLAPQIATLAEGYLALPSGAGAQLVPLIADALKVFAAECRPSYRQEIAATVEWVGAGMAARGVAF